MCQLFLKKLDFSHGLFFCYFEGNWVNPEMESRMNLIETYYSMLLVFDKYGCILITSNGCIAMYVQNIKDINPPPKGTHVHNHMYVL